MPFAHHQDTQLYYEVHGSGPPLILIAGYSCDHTFWSLMLEELKHFQVIVMDNRGVGQTKDDGSAFTLETLAQDIARLMDTLNIKRAPIVGQSMGGAIAQIFAKRYPEKVEKLVILNSVAKFSARALQAIANTTTLGSAGVPLEILAQTVALWIYSTKSLENAQFMKMAEASFKENPYPQSFEDQRRQLHALSEFDARAWCKTIQAPTQVIAAREDIICLLAESQQLAQSIPGAVFAEVSGAHASPIEEPRAVSGLISRFLADSR